MNAASALSTFAVVVAVFAAFGLGRFIERRVWNRQRTLMFDLMSDCSERLRTMHSEERQALDVIRAQRSLLEVVATAYETGQWETTHPSGRRINRIAWVATEARKELL